MNMYCRLCLSMTSEHFYEVNNSKYQKKLETLIPELNIKSIKAPLLCEECNETLQAAYIFKTNSLRVDKHLMVFVEITNTDLVPVSEVLKIRKELNNFVDIEKIEENSVSCEGVNSHIKIESESVLDVKQEDTQYFSNEEDCKTADNLYKGHPISIKSETELSEKNSDLKCVECDKKFRTYRQFKQHQLYHTNNHYKCNINDCDEIFIMKVDLTKHKKQHSKFQCSVCGNIKQSYRTYQNHLRKHSGLFRCKTCAMDFQNSAQLKSHEVVHTGLREFVCDLCGKGFGQASTLRTHINSVHTTEKPYACKVCGKGFKQSTLQRQHMITMHLEPDRKHTCSICGKQLRFKSSLWEHMKRHSGERKYACKICEKRFFDSAGLKKHVVIHGNDKPHECPYCFKRTNQKSNLKIHLRSCTKRKQAEQANVSNSSQPDIEHIS